MKSLKKEVKSRRPSCDQGKKSIPTSAATSNIKKINYSIPMKMTTTTATKSVILHSHRATSGKPDPSNHQKRSKHSRKLSIQNNCKESSKGGRSKSKNSKQHHHARSNSTLSKKSSKPKNCLKIDLSKLTGRNEKDIKIVIEKKKKQEQLPVEVGRNHFQFQYVIGKGGFGKVWSVVMKKTGQPYAMKEMNKSKIIAKKSIPSVLNERKLLSQLKHPFLVNMSYSFQDREKLYLVLDLLIGGDLRYHMGQRRFRQTESKFFIASILMGLQFLHFHNIIHRDIKPENIVFDDNGYLRITDLGIASIMKPNNNSDTSGTPGYMAPEVMCRLDHSFSVDYYAVGIIAYELMLKRRPYNGTNRKQIQNMILSKQVQIRPEQIPAGWSPEAANFINKMIQRKPANRLGTDGGLIEIKDHVWFKGFPWGHLLKKTLSSPFVPKNILGSQDYLDQITETSEDENEQQNRLLLKNQEAIKLLKEYSYYEREEKKISAGTKNSSTTSHTHGSNNQEREKESHGGPKKQKNNFFKF